MPRVDVVVPCYNYGRFLADCVRSITSQSHQDLRVLIIDNASTDDSAAVAHALAREDDRVSVVARSENLGPHASYNEGIDWASGDYFVILDADDVMPPGAMARAVAIMEQHPSVAFLHGTEFASHFEAGEMPDLPKDTGNPKIDIESGTAFIARMCGVGFNSVGATTVFRRTASQRRAGHFRPALTYADDLEMCLRLATGEDVIRISSVQGVRRLHVGQATEQFRADPVRDAKEHLAAFESYFANEGQALVNASQLLEATRKTIARNAVGFGSWHVREGRIDAGRACIGYAIGLAPGASLVNLVYQLARRHLPLTAAPALLLSAVMSRS